MNTATYFYRPFASFFSSLKRRFKPFVSCFSSLFFRNARNATSRNRIFKSATEPHNPSPISYNRAIVVDSSELHTPLPTQILSSGTAVDLSSSLTAAAEPPKATTVNSSQLTDASLRKQEETSSSVTAAVPKARGSNETAPFSTIPYFSQETHIVVHPNETDPHHIGEHLKNINVNDVLITTGIQRSFLLACSPCIENPKFQGFIVIRDMNREVYEYNNAVIMLLKLARDQEHFIHLARVIDDKSPRGEYETRYREISQLLVEHKEIPETMRKHYEKHLNTMLKLYLLNEQPWREDKDFKERNYHLPQNKELFLNLQKLAKAGHILPMLGPIDNLEPIFKNFAKQRIGAIDASNIPDYTLRKFSIEFR